MSPMSLDESRGRSFSTDPRRRASPSPARLGELRELENEATRALTVALDREAQSGALIARTGSDLSSLRFEDERPRFTHVGIAVYEQGEWWVHQLLNTHEGPEGHLYRQPLIDFFRDDPIDYDTALLVPSLELQDALRQVVSSRLRSKLYTPRYSRVAYPFSTRYINSNQWVAELIGAAQGGGSTRVEVQRFLHDRGLRPSTLLGVGPAQQLWARLRTRNTYFDDHPPAQRLRGRLELMLETSLYRYVCATDSVRSRTLVRAVRPAPLCVVALSQDSRYAPTA